MYVSRRLDWSAFLNFLHEGIHDPKLVARNPNSNETRQSVAEGRDKTVGHTSKHNFPDGFDDIENQEDVRYDVPESTFPVMALQINPFI